jgi:hypothetical protein
VCCMHGPLAGTRKHCKLTAEAMALKKEITALTRIARKTMTAIECAMQIGSRSLGEFRAGPSCGADACTRSADLSPLRRARFPNLAVAARYREISRAVHLSWTPRPRLNKPTPTIGPDASVRSKVSEI